MNNTQEQFDWHNTVGCAPEEPTRKIRYADEDASLDLESIQKLFDGFNVMSDLHKQQHTLLKRQIQTQHNLLKEQRKTISTQRDVSEAAVKLMTKCFKLLSAKNKKKIVNEETITKEQKRLQDALKCGIN